MATKKISELANATTVADTDAFEIVQSGANKYVFLSAIATWFLGSARTFAAIVSINRASGTNRAIRGQTAGVNRWGVNLGNVNVETGSNAGSDFEIERYDDSGTSIDKPIGIKRDTGVVFLVGKTSDPTGTAGGIYYNSSTGKFRGYNGVAAAWQDLN